MSILALSSVTSSTIQTFYPDSGALKYKTVLSQVVEPKIGPSTHKAFILFSRLGRPAGQFMPNHFVPLILKSIRGSLKRKTVASIFKSSSSTVVNKSHAQSKLFHYILLKELIKSLLQELMKSLLQVIS